MPQKRLTISIPDDVARAINRIAVRESRSVSAQVTHMLRPLLGLPTPGIPREIDQDTLRENDEFLGVGG